MTKDKDSQRYVYDGENKQTQFYAAGNSTTTPDAVYSYDGDGRRVKKVVGSETTVFVYNASGQMLAEYSTATLPANPSISYLTSDTLGTPRINTDALGQVKARHDYLPFGEEIIGMGGRTTQQGYVVADNVRQKFTSKERDNETGLDYFGARYYGSNLGRFTSVDPLMASARASSPQSWNRYIYCYNNPLRYIDPDGMDVQTLDDKASDLLIKTLPKEIREQVNSAIDKNGLLVKGSLDKIKSKDANFLALKAMVNAKEVTEVATSAIGQNGTPFFKTTAGAQYEKDIQAYMQANNVSRADAEKIISKPADPSEEWAYYGQTFSPNGEENTPVSPSGNLRAVVTDRTGDAAGFSEEDAVITMGHELYGHSYKFRVGDKTWKDEGPAMKAIEERTRKNYRDGEQKKNNPSNIKPKQ